MVKNAEEFVAECEKEELKPCPFCGGSVERYNPMPEYVGGYGFWCPKCRSEFLIGDDDEEATKKWNMRYTAK